MQNIKDSQTENKQHVYVIRHAESEYNLAQFNYGGEKAATTVANENIDIKFDPKLLDSPLTDKGNYQCINTKELLKDQDIKLVIVSPLKRALETCNNIFKDHKSSPKFIVDPLFREHLSSTCDIGSQILESQKSFKNYDFSFLNEYQYPKLWCLYGLLNKQFQQQAFEYIENKSNKNEQIIKEQGHLFLLEYLKLQFPQVIDSKQDTMKRALLQRQQVHKICQKYNIQENDKIAVVGHRQNLQCFTADSLNIEKEEVLNGISLKNAEFCEIFV